MFENTVNGIVHDGGEIVSYTFPADAACKINGISISLANLKVNCFGGDLSHKTNSYFSLIASLVKPTSTLINTSLFIYDQDISHKGYPEPEDFKKYGIPFISRDELNVLQTKVILTKTSTPEYKQWVDFLYRWTEDNRKNLKDQISAALNSKSKFPKQLSLIYDDRQFTHCSHIVLQFENAKKCSLLIDNTVSVAFSVGSKVIEYICKEHKTTFEKFDERISEKNPKFLELRHNKKDKKPFISLESAKPINTLLKENQYKRMIDLLSSLGFEITNTLFRHNYNQKTTSECVPFAIQNKLDFVLNTELHTQESPRDKGIRFRAEQAVLSYLLSGLTSIPMDTQDPQDLHGIFYNNKNWYPSFNAVCEKLLATIISLPKPDLKQLLEAKENETQLAESIKSQLLKKPIAEAPAEQPKLLPIFDLTTSISKANLWTQANLIFSNTDTEEVKRVSLIVAAPKLN